MNILELLQKQISTQFPSANTDIAPPTNPAVESWLLSVAHNGKLVIIEWEQGQKFGISDYSEPNGGRYGEGPDEKFDGIEATFQRVIHLLGH